MDLECYLGLKNELCRKHKSAERIEKKIRLSMLRKHKNKEHKHKHHRRSPRVIPKIIISNTGNNPHPVMTNYVNNVKYVKSDTDRRRRSMKKIKRRSKRHIRHSHKRRTPRTPRK